MKAPGSLSLCTGGVWPLNHILYGVRLLAPAFTFHLCHQWQLAAAGTCHFDLAALTAAPALEDLELTAEN